MHNTIKLLLGLLVALIGVQAQALTINAPTYTDCLLDPDCYLGPSGPPASNPTTSILEQTILNQGGSAVSLFELYKENVGDGFDSGTYASSYDSIFYNPPTSPEDALIRYVGGASIDCPECFLLVKDGASVPNWYLFDIGGWNGTDYISLLNFWTGPGAISHISIYGATATVPEPAILALLGIGLAGLGLRRFIRAS